MLAEEINRIIDTYIDQKKQITDALEKLPPNEFGVLHRYYIKYMTLEQIAEDMGYCRQQIWRFKKKGLNNLKDVIECYITHAV
jgi:DNA-directed RNA polymerase specialized sigma subunit